MTVMQRIGVGIFLVVVAAALGAASLNAGDTVPAVLRTGGLATAAFLCGLALALLWRGDVLPAALSGYGFGVILVAAIGLASTPVNGLLPTFLALTFGTAALVSLAMALHRIWTTGETVRLESDWGD